MDGTREMGEQGGTKGNPPVPNLGKEVENVGIDQFRESRDRC